MALITSYTNLQTEVISELDRSDLVAHVPRFIQGAEGVLRRDLRVKKLRITSPFAVAAATASVPTGFKFLDSLSYPAGASVSGDLDVGTIGDLSNTRKEWGDSGAPRKMAVVDGSFYFAPVPDQSYAMILTWWEGVQALGGALLQNWLLQEHPDIYFYATLLESAPYLREDTRIPVWESILKARLEELDFYTQAQAYSGPMSMPTRGQF